MRNETFRDSVLIEWGGVDGTDWVHWVDGAEVERRPATADELAAAQPAPAGSTLDLVALAARQAEQQAQLDAQGDALDFLILDSLGGL